MLKIKRKNAYRRKNYIYRAIINDFQEVKLVHKLQNGDEYVPIQKDNA